MPIRLIAGIQGWVCSPAGALAGVSLSCTAPQGPQHNSAVTANTFRSDQRDNHALSFFFDCRGQVGASHLGSSSCASVGVQWPVESSAMVVTLESARAVPGHCLRRFPVLRAVRVHAHERMCRHAVHIQPGRWRLCAQDMAPVLTLLPWMSRVLLMAAQFSSCSGWHDALAAASWSPCGGRKSFLLTQSDVVQSMPIAWGAGMSRGLRHAWWSDMLHTWL